MKHFLLTTIAVAILFIQQVQLFAQSHGRDMGDNSSAGGGGGFGCLLYIGAFVWFLWRYDKNDHNS